MIKRSLSATATSVAASALVGLVLVSGCGATSATGSQDVSVDPVASPSNLPTGQGATGVPSLDDPASIQRGYTQRTAGCQPRVLPAPFSMVDVCDYESIARAAIITIYTWHPVTEADRRVALRRADPLLSPHTISALNAGRIEFPVPPPGDANGVFSRVDNRESAFPNPPSRTQWQGWRDAGLMVTPSRIDPGLSKSGRKYFVVHLTLVAEPGMKPAANSRWRAGQELAAFAVAPYTPDYPGRGKVVETIAIEGGG